METGRHTVAQRCTFSHIGRLLFVAVLLASTLSGCTRFFYYPSDAFFIPAERLGMQWRPYSFPRPGGGELTAAVIPGQGPDSGKGLAILFHGNAQNMTAHWTNLAWMVRHGWDLLVWDYSGYGASDGKASQKQVAQDSRAFLDWAADSILPRTHGRVVMVGQSLGGAILLRAFPEWKARTRVDLVLVEGSFDSYRAMARDVVSRNWFTWPLTPFVPLLVSDAESPAPWIPKVAPTPLLIVSCSEDKSVPPPLQLRINALAHDPHWLWNVSGCRHISAFRQDSMRLRLLSLLDSLPLGRQ